MTATTPAARDGVSILRPALAMPPGVVHQEEITEVLARHFRDVPHLERGLELMRNTSVRTRHLLVPADELVDETSFGERNARYSKEVVRLGVEAAVGALEQSGVAARDVDALVLVSCTGYMLPGPDAYIAQEIGLRSTARRWPVQQLGCAAGVSALAGARDFVLAHPGSQALVVAVELPSLSFQPRCSSLSDFISNALFADGAAAAVVRQDPAAPGFQITGAVQHLLPGSTDVIYGDTSEHGFHFETNPKVRKAVPQIVPVLKELLTEHGLTTADLGFCVSHTGGPLVMTGVQEGLDLPPEALEPSRRSLAEIGNPSSVSVFDVLDRHHANPPPDGSHGLMLAFGPGFTSEALIGRWRRTAGGTAAAGPHTAGPHAARPHTARPHAAGAPATVTGRLTVREQQVATLVAEGMTNRQISRQLAIAEWTAVHHVRNVMRKLDVSSRVQVARWLITTAHESRPQAGATALPGMS